MQHLQLNMTPPLSLSSVTAPSDPVSPVQVSHLFVERRLNGGSVWLMPARQGRRAPRRH